MKLLEEEGLEAVLGGAELVNKEPLSLSAPEDKRPSLTLEELEAKQGNSVQEVFRTSKANVIKKKEKTLILFHFTKMTEKNIKVNN